VPARGGAAHEIAEHFVEDIGKAAEIATAGPARTGAAALEGGVAKAVIGRALLFVLQDVVGLVRFLEVLLALLGRRIAITDALLYAFEYRRIDSPQQFRILAKVLRTEEIGKRGRKKLILAQTVNIDEIDEKVLKSYLQDE